MIKIFSIVSISTVSALLLNTTSIFAHAVVSPKEVGVAAFQDFSLGVPSEKDASTTSVRLMLPAGLNFVSPVVKPGWKVEVKNGPISQGMTPPTAADGDVGTSIPTEIDWTGGTIPSGQKDIFVFSAQVPAKAGELDWKVYQGFSDGSTVSWDLGPNGEQPKDSKGSSDFSSKGPYSKTMVVNDLKVPNNSSPAAPSQSSAPLILSILAILLSVGVLGMQFKKK